MGRVSRNELFDITEDVRRGKMGAIEAVNAITANGNSREILAIGSVVSSKTHYPMPALEGHEPPSPSESPYWDLRLNPEQGSGIPILRAGSIASTAIHAAFGGDINILQQRMVVGELLTPFYRGPTYGWEFDPETNAYILKIHQGYLPATSSIDDHEIIGVVDLVEGNDFDVQIPDEPGHFGSYVPHDRIGSLAVRMRDVRKNIAASAIRYINY